MINYLAKQIIAAIINILVVILLVFFLMNVLPSDPARVRLGVRYNEESASAIKSEYGLDKPLTEQFSNFILNLTQGEWGNSIITGESIRQSLVQRSRRSFGLIFLSIIMTIPVAVMGIKSARSKNIMPLIVEIVLLGVSAVPIFVLAVSAIFLSNEWFHVSLIPSITGWASLPYYILPALLLSIYPSFLIFKICKDKMQDILEQQFILAHQAFGFSGRHIILVYALKNCAVSILGITSNLTAYYFSSIFIIEFVFSIGGVGSWAVRSAQNYDVPVVLSTVLFFAVIYNIVNIATAFSAPLFDRRIIRE